MNNFREALQASLDRICEVTGWPGGHVHLVDGQRLISNRRLASPHGTGRARAGPEVSRVASPAGDRHQESAHQPHAPGWIKLGTTAAATTRSATPSPKPASEVSGASDRRQRRDDRADGVLRRQDTSPDTALLEAMEAVGSAAGGSSAGPGAGAPRAACPGDPALSITDELTGILNRRGFIALASQQMKVSSRRKERCCLFFMDMDGLKAINDQRGTGLEGDLALRRLAEVLIRSFRQADLVVRLGGDEFVAWAADATEVGRIADWISRT